MLIGLHHTAISTPDLQRAITFYCDTLGGTQACEIMSWGPGEDIPDRMLQLKNSSGQYVHVKVGNAFLEIFQFSGPTPVAVERRVCDYGLAHLCFVVDDLDAEHRRLTQRGMVFHAEPAGYSDGSKLVYGRDCDGNIIELLEIPPGASTPNIGQ